MTGRQVDQGVTPAVRSVRVQRGSCAVRPEARGPRNMVTMETPDQEEINMELTRTSVLHQHYVT